MERMLGFPNLGWEKVYEEQAWVKQVAAMRYDSPT